MDTNRIWRECNQCGKKLASYKTMWQHRKTCKYSGSEDKILIETASNQAADNNKGSKHQQSKDSSLSRFIDNIINKDPDSVNSMIQPSKSIPMNHVKDNTTRNSEEEEPIEETLSAEKNSKETKH